MGESFSSFLSGKIPDMTKELKNWVKNISAKLWEIMQELELREHLASLSESYIIYWSVERCI